MEYSLDETLTASQAARLLNVHVNTLRRWTNNGILKSHRVGRRHDRRLTQRDIEYFLHTSSSSSRS